MSELKPVAWFCTKDADGKPLLEKFWSTNPRYVEVHSRCDWTPVFTIPADQVLVPRRLLEDIEKTWRIPHPQARELNERAERAIEEGLHELRTILQP